MTEQAKTNPVDAAIAAAEAASKAAPAAAGTEMTMVQATPAQGAVATYSAPRAVSLQDLQQQAAVDQFIKLSEYGLVLTKEQKTPIPGPIRLKVDLAQLEKAFFEGVSYSNPPIYVKTYDREFTTSGEPWVDALAKARKADPKVKPYVGLDFSGKTVTDVKSVDGKEILAKAGVTLGYATTYTAGKNVKDFFAQIEKLGLTGKVILVDLGYESMNRNGYSWGIPTFTVIGEATE